MQPGRTLPPGLLAPLGVLCQQSARLAEMLLPVTFASNSLRIRLHRVSLKSIDPKTLRLRQSLTIPQTLPPTPPSPPQASSLQRAGAHGSPQFRPHPPKNA